MSRELTWENLAFAAVTALIASGLVFIYRHRRDK